MVRIYNRTVVGWQQATLLISRSAGVLTNDSRSILQQKRSCNLFLFSCAFVVA
jgi:hypothetical protein